jgi:hypothetical protein
MDSDVSFIGDDDAYDFYQDSGPSTFTPERWLMIAMIENAVLDATRRGPQCAQIQRQAIAWLRSDDQITSLRIVRSATIWAWIRAELADAWRKRSRRGRCLARRSYAS